MQVTPAFVFQMVVFIFGLGIYYQQNRQMITEVKKLRGEIMVVRRRAVWLKDTLVTFFLKNGWEFESYDESKDDEILKNV